MNLKNIFDETDDSRAVSPVIGVILMVAITVILAAVIGTFVLGLGDNVQSAPQAQLQIQENTTDAQEFDIKHRGGESIDYNEFDIVIDGNAESGTYSYGDSKSTSVYINNDDDVLDVGETDTIEFGSGSGSTDVVVEVTMIHVPSDNIVLERDVTIDGSSP